MKPYVIQYRKHDWDPWQVCPDRKYDTLQEAKAAFEALLFKTTGCRIAESFIQVRYKAVKAEEAAS